MKTISLKEKEIKRSWYLVDAKDKILGRLVSQITPLLVGKHKPGFSYHQDIGDWVVVINCEKIEVTGKKRTDKIYYHHTGYPGGLKEVAFKELMKKDPSRIIFLAVKGMLPKNKLRARRLKRLRIFVGEDHPYKDKKLLPFEFK